MMVEIILLVMLANLIFGIALYNKVRDLYKYPNLLGFPVVGNLYYFYKHLLFIYSKDCSERYFSNVSAKYGMDVFFTFIHGIPCLVLASPKHIEEIAHHPFASEKPESMYGGFRYVIYGPFSSVGPEDEWKIKRKEYNKALNRSLIEKVYHDVLTRCAKALAQQMGKDATNVDLFYHVVLNYINTSKATFFKMDDYMITVPPGIVKKGLGMIHIGGTTMANNIFRCLFGFLTKHVDIIQVLGPLYIKYKAKILKDLEEQYSSYVGADSFLDPSEIPLAVAISNRRNKKKNDNSRDLVAELFEILLTATHTTGMAVIGALTYLATIPEIQEKVWKEQYEIFGESTRDPTIEDMKRMTYLDRFIKESLRFTAPPSVMKTLTGELNLGGMTVPSGTNVLILMHKIRKDPRYWTRPEVFNPDRFLNEDNIPKYAYAPFGIGIRSCPGKHYAIHQMKMTISTLIRRFKLSSNQKFEELEYNLSIMVEIAKLSPLQMELRE